MLRGRRGGVKLECRPSFTMCFYRKVFLSQEQVQNGRYGVHRPWTDERGNATLRPHGKFDPRFAVCPLSKPRLQAQLGYGGVPSSVVRQREYSRPRYLRQWGDDAVLSSPFSNLCLTFSANFSQRFRVLRRNPLRADPSAVFIDGCVALCECGLLPSFPPPSTSTYLLVDVSTLWLYL